MEDLDNNRDYLERPSVELKSPSSPHTGSTNSLCSSNRDSPTAPPHQEERDELLLCTRQHGPSLDLDDEIFGCEPHRSSWQDSWQDDPKHNQKGEIPCASSFEPGSDILLPQRRDDHERCLKGSSLPSSISPPPRYKSERQVYVNARTGENSALTGRKRGQHSQERPDDAHSFISSEDSTELKRRQRDPRLAHKAEGQHKKLDSDPGHEGQTPAQIGQLQPPMQRASPPQHQPRGRSPPPSTRGASFEGPKRGNSPKYYDHHDQSPPLSVDIPSATCLLPKDAASVSPRASSDSAPADPRRRRQQPSPRVGDGVHGIAATSKAGPIPISLPTTKPFSWDVPERASEILASSRVVACSGRGGIRVGAIADLNERTRTCGSQKPRIGAYNLKGSLLTKLADSESIESKKVIDRGPKIREVKKETRPAGPRFARLPSDTRGFNSRMQGPPPAEKQMRQEHLQDPMHHHKANRRGSGGWEKESRPPLAVSIERVTLGGIAPPPGHTAGVHVRLPLRGQHPSTHQVVLPTGPPLPSQEHNPRWRPPFHHESPPPRNPLNESGMVIGAVRLPSALPLLPPGQHPWLNRQSSADSFLGGSGSESIDRGGGGFSHLNHPPMNHPPVTMSSPQQIDVDPQLLPGGGQRRSAYAQAMHNKRFMGSAKEGQAGEVGGAIVSKGGGGAIGGANRALGAGFRPPPKMSECDPHPPLRRHNYTPKPMFQKASHPGSWKDGYRGNGVDMSVGSVANGGGVGHHPPMGSTAVGQAWGFLCDNGDDDDEPFPLVHTSPEWTPAVGLGAPIESQQQEASLRNKSSIGSDDDTGSDGSNGNSGGGTRADVVKQQDAMVDKGKTGLKRESEACSPSSGLIQVSESNPKSPIENTDQVAEKKLVKTSETKEGISLATAAVGDGTEAFDGDPGFSFTSAGTIREQDRLEPSPLAKVSWSIRDLAYQFPRITIPESLSHVIASWTVLDTRAIGVVPMLCQPIAKRSTEGENGSNESGKETSSGKRKRAKYKTDFTQRKGRGVTGGSYRSWEARVIVPFGIIPEQATAGRWAEAFRLVLAPLPAVTTSCEMHDEDVDDGDVAAINAIAAATEGVLTLPGGPWNEELDGRDPEAEDNIALINTAVRACKRSGGVDLTRCSSWLKFCELHEEDRTTVVFLCGGGASIAEGTSGDLHVATISELIKGSVSTGDEGGKNRRRIKETTFEAKLGAEFLWGMVSRDWAGVMLDCLRLEAVALEKKVAGGAMTASSNGENAAAGLLRQASATVWGKGASDTKPKMKKIIGDLSPMVETRAEIRAAFGLFDRERKGWVAGDRLQQCLIDAGFRVSTRYLKSLLRSLCRVAEDGNQMLFEYRRRLASEKAGIGKAEEISGAPPTDSFPTTAPTATT